MSLLRSILFATALTLNSTTFSPIHAAEPPVKVRLAENPALSPDGRTLAFAWSGDVWTVSSNGGVARRVTHHEAKDRQPAFSPDGKTLAFVSDREGSPQVYTIPVRGGDADRKSWHTSGSDLLEWSPDGEKLLTRGLRDHFWRHAQRLFLIDADERTAERALFDDYADDARLSPDGTKVLFTREGPAWWRKAYYGSQAAQIWMYDLKNKKFEQLLAPETGAKWPLWKPDGNGFYFIGNGDRKSWNLCAYDFGTKAIKTLTRYDDDSVVFPAISRDGSTIVFRRLFDLYRLDPNGEKAPTRLNITATDDDVRREPFDRKTLSTAKDFTLSRDGLEIAFIAGGDVWVMDTELREPRQVTETPEEEREPVFTPDGNGLLFISDAWGKTDIWRAERGEKTKYWWLNDDFPQRKLTDDNVVESQLSISPDGERIAFVRGLGDLHTMTLEGKDVKRIVASWNAPQYDWSPDGKWFAYALSDDDFNSDVWIVPSDASKPAVNVSRHPDNDGRPVWSPDGKLLAFTGKRDLDQSDIHYVWLRAGDDEGTRRERTLTKALEKMQKARKPGIIPAIINPSGTKAAPPVKTPVDPPMTPPKDPSAKTDPVKAEPAKTEPTPQPDMETDADQTASDQTGAVLPTITRNIPFLGGEKKPVEVRIDFEGLHERVHRVTIPNTSEANLVWSPDGKKLAFSASIEGKAGLYAIEFPDNLKPTQVAAVTGSQPYWIDAGFVMLVGGTPTLVTQTSSTPYRFNVKQTVDRAARHAAIFDQCWKTMRDRYYDERLGNKNWDAIRRKYLDAAHDAVDMDGLTVVIQLMLGELNGSHLGFTVRPEGSPLPDPNAPPPSTPEPVPGLTRQGWNETTAHLGVRFDAEHRGPGWKIRDVLPHGPADRDATRLRAGETILSIDGKAVDPAMDATLVLNGAPDRDLTLKVADEKGKERTVALRPTTFADARRLLYEAWMNTSRASVDALSDGKFGYLHIAGMNMPSFYKFEEELASIAYGKAGLVIDVRENGGGSTADHLLTILSQPRHAITVPRGGGQGYPQDRIVYATWNKPIVVLCNQNSFSNAEIFSHAIKTLKRGKLVGAPTAGGVISTGAVSIFDIGTLRMPFRGWYHPETGEDMELNGAVPDVIVLPQPGEMPRGKDTQLEKAIEVLKADVKTWDERKPPKLRKAMER